VPDATIFLEGRNKMTRFCWFLLDNTLTCLVMCSDACSTGLFVYN